MKELKKFMGIKHSMKKIKNIETGFSIYLSTNREENLKILDKGYKNLCKYVFSSINIKEENVDKKSLLKDLIIECNKRNLNLIIDINSETKNIISLENNYNNIFLRIDDGISLDEIYHLSTKYKVVLNTSIVTRENLEYLKSLNIDFSNILGLYNYYPKRFTGLSKDFIYNKNKLFKEYGIKTMGFVKGDKLRGPCYEGLVSCENHRNIDFLESCLDLVNLGIDICLIGDIDLSNINWKRFKYLSFDIIALRNEDNILLNEIFKDRNDSSDYVIRHTSLDRNLFKEYINSKLINIEKINSEIKVGDILISNEKYLRYEGELEIAIKDLGYDEKRDIISKVVKEDLNLLKYISLIKNFTFIENQEI